MASIIASSIRLSSLAEQVKELGYEEHPEIPGLFYIVAGAGGIPVVTDEDELICFPSELTKEELSQCEFHFVIGPDGLSIE